VCEADAREGGRILIHMRAPDGNVHPMGGIFHEVKPHDRIVFTSFVDLPDGRRVLEGLNTVTFEEQRGRTTVTVHARAEGYVDFAAQMLAGMEAGWSQSLDKLAGHGLRVVGAKDADDQEKIRAIFGDRTNALFGKSVELAVKPLADDLVSYDLDPPLAHVGPGRQGLQDWFDTWDGPIAWAMRDTHVEVGGDIAFAYGLGHMTGTKKDGAKVDLWARVTVGLNRRDGVWKITHQHTSVPFRMDGSFKAAVDLQP
jgi:PhnB protein